jgi:branched-chain amino acid transport system ATP-binding protein
VAAAALAGEEMIVCQDIHKHFGGFRAVDGVSLEIPAGAITGLIGPNGAGKSTLFNIIAGVHKPTAGKVTMAGEDITGLPPHALFAKGLLRTFQIAQEFGSLSVLENLMTVPGGQIGERLWNTWVNRRGIAEEEERLRAKAEGVLEFLTLPHLRDERAGNLSGGQKKLLELGRTMMVDARIVFLDEVGAGVNRTLLTTVGDTIVRLNKERGYTFCVIEHDMDFIARLCDSVIVMAQGKVLAKGTPGDIMRNEQVIEAYLGTGLKNKVVAAGPSEALLGAAAP